MTDNKKLKIMSLSVTPEMHEMLKISAKNVGKNVSELLRELIDKHLDLVVNDNEEIPVILRIPSEMKGPGNEAQLKTWLDARVNAIVSKLCQ